MGVYAESDDANAPGVDAHGINTGAYGSSATSAKYRGAYVKATGTGFYGLYVDDQGSTVGSRLAGDVTIVGNLLVTGAKTGYVVDVMQNADSAPLEPGDVVTIAGSGAPVLGSIPVVLVKKAAAAYDTGVVGVVDQVLYVPDAATKAAYEAQEQARQAALAQRQQAEAAAGALGANKADLAQMPVPPALISDGEGTMHALAGASQVPTHGYTNVVTLGAYKALKVDAGFGAIKAGDLLTSSPHAGYAMRVTDRAAANGAVIGKALGDLAAGTGLLPVMVTLK